MSGRHRVCDGDWVCDNEKCGNVNFARRSQCNRCGAGKSRSKIKDMGVAIGKHLAEKSHGLFSAEDWQCKTCGNVNWARRAECNVCKMPKMGKVESRTGYGGGFNERENVEYNKREDSDDEEYDEFGRKKKKYRQKVPPKPKEDEDEKEKVDDDDEEEEDDGDLNAYKLDSEDEDDDDGDLNKYDLTDDEEKEEKKPETTVTPKTSRSPSRTPKTSRSPSRSSQSSSSSGDSRKGSWSGSSRSSRSRSGSRSNSRSRKRRRSSSNSRSRSRSRSRSGSADHYEPKKRR